MDATRDYHSEWNKSERADIIWYHLYLESKTYTVKLSMKQKQTHRQREQTGGCQGGWVSGRMEWEAGVRCKLLYRDKINNKVLLHSSGRLYFGGLQNHCYWWLQPWNKKTLTPWKESYDQFSVDSILKSRHYFVNKGPSSQAMVFPVMYGCESWTIKKAEHWRSDAFELWCWRRLLRVPWTARRSNQSSLKEISPECSLEGLMLKLKLILWPPDVKNWFTGKDPDAGKDWRQEEKGITEDEVVGWHLWLSGHEFG